MTAMSYEICQAAIFPSRSFAQRADEFQSKGKRKGAKVGDSVCENSAMRTASPPWVVVLLYAIIIYNLLYISGIGSSTQILDGIGTYFSHIPEDRH